MPWHSRNSHHLPGLPMIALAPILLLLAANPFGRFGGSGVRGNTAGSAVSRPTTVAGFGDSILAGTCSTSPLVYLDELLPGGSTSGYLVSNRAVAGETTHQIYGRVVAGAATACLGEPCGTYIVQGGVNTLKDAAWNASSASATADIALNGSGTCSATLNTCGTLDSVDYLHATYPNARIMVIGVLPYAGCSNVVCPSLVEPGPRARAYNSALQAACASRTWLYCVLPYSNFEDTDNADNLDPAYACADDHLHLEDAGSSYLAQFIYNAASW